MLLKSFKCPLKFLATLERASLNDEILARSTMLPSLFVRDHLAATFAGKVNDLELIAEVAIHNGRIESICLAARTAHGLVEPLL